MNINLDDTWSRDDSMDVDDEFSINTLIIKFVRQRETYEFERTLREKYTSVGKLALTVKERITNDLLKMRGAMRVSSGRGSEFSQPEPRHASRTCVNDPSDDADDNDDDDEYDENHFGQGMFYRGVHDATVERRSVSQEAPSKPLWRQTWTQIEQTLNNLMLADTAVFFKCYNLILKLHIEQRVSLDPACFSCLIISTEPAHINDIFSRGLVSTRNINHINCLLANRSIFTALNYSMYTNASSEPVLLLFSLTVLLYKTVCAEHSKRLSHSIMSKLVPFINRNTYPESFKKVACKHFLKGKTI
jgi:hypothetical protein